MMMVHEKTTKNKLNKIQETQKSKMEEKEK